MKDISKNGNFIKILLAMLLATVTICELPILFPIIGSMFSTEAFGLMGWLIVLVVSLLIIPIDMVRKIICGTYRTPKSNS